MPPLIKQSVPHILISMIVAPIMLTLFAWAGTNIISTKVETSEAKAKIPYIIKTLDEIHNTQIVTSSKMDSVLVFMYENKASIVGLQKDNDRCKDGLSRCERMHDVK